MAVFMEQTEKFRRWFGVGFVISFALFLAVLVVPLCGGNDHQTLLAWASFLASCTALIGFVVTTVMAWRKERRETEHPTVDLAEKRKLELEKLRRDIRENLSKRKSRNH
jgi:apolipoprotein N-acyltransferase